MSHFNRVPAPAPFALLTLLAICLALPPVAPLAAQTTNTQLIRLGTLSSTGTAAVTPKVNFGNNSFPVLSTVQATSTSQPTTCTMVMDFSLDGNEWWDATGTQNCAVANASSGVGAYISVVNELTRYIRVRLTALVGTAASTVKAAVETLTELNFTTHVNWATTGDFLDTGGNCAYTHSSGTGACIQADSGYANPIVASKLYTFEYTVSGVSGAPVCQITSGCSAALDLDETNGVKVTECTSTSTITDDFTITCTSGAAAGITFDDVSWHEQNCTNASPIAITTTAAHGLVTGEKVTIAGATGNTACNVTGGAVTVLTATTLTLDGTTGNAPWTAAGTLTTAPEVSFLYLGGGN